MSNENKSLVTWQMINGYVKTNSLFVPSPGELITKIENEK